VCTTRHLSSSCYDVSLCDNYRFTLTSLFLGTPLSIIA
jgi:hypothetical protein